MFFALSHNQGLNIKLKWPIANGNLTISACSLLFSSCNVHGFVDGVMETPRGSKLGE
jgi:hypothetical protein